VYTALESLRADLSADILAKIGSEHSKQVRPALSDLDEKFTKYDRNHIPFSCFLFVKTAKR
jgi:hypothetical protein